jgi:hypothetical protein
MDIRAAVGTGADVYMEAHVDGVGGDSGCGGQAGPLCVVKLSLPNWHWHCDWVTGAHSAAVQLAQHARMHVSMIQGPACYWVRC